MPEMQSENTKQFLIFGLNGILLEPAEEGAESSPYPGVHQMLRSLRDAGFQMAVVEDLPEEEIRELLKRHRLAKYFSVISQDQGEGVSRALRQFFPGGEIRFDRVFPVVDRAESVEKLHGMGLECVGVTYGHSAMEDLREAKCDYIVREVGELRKFLLREAPETDPLTGGPVDTGTSTGTASQNAGSEGRMSSGTGVMNGGGNAATGQRPAGKRPKFGFREVWKVLYIFLLFFVARSLVQSALAVLLSTVAEKLPAGLSDFCFVRGEDGAIVNYSGNAAAIITGIGFCAGAAIVWKRVVAVIRKAWEEMHLTHLVKPQTWVYVCMTLVTIGATVGLNFFFALIGATESSQEYQAIAELQYSAVFGLGLLVYGIISPITEELMFRGLMFNYLKKFFPVQAVILMTAALFAFYHGNSTQGSYAFLMGLLLAYAYEYFGTFKAPLLIHVGANVLSYCLTYVVQWKPQLQNWGLCIVMLALSVVGLLLLNKERKIG